MLIGSMRRLQSLLQHPHRALIKTETVVILGILDMHQQVRGIAIECLLKRLLRFVDPVLFEQLDPQEGARRRIGRINGQGLCEGLDRLLAGLLMLWIEICLRQAEIALRARRLGLNRVLETHTGGLWITPAQTGIPLFKQITVHGSPPECVVPPLDTPAILSVPRPDEATP